MHDWLKIVTIILAIGGSHWLTNDSLGNRIGSLGSRIDRTDAKVDTLNSNLADVRERLTRVETKLDVLVPLLSAEKIHSQIDRSPATVSKPK